jgi:signal transduction histidine kinase
METAQRFDAIDTRLIYRAYAALLGLSGIALVGWGPLWLGAHLPGQPWGKAALIRVLGSIVIAIGCFTAPLADLPPLARRRALLWLAAGYAVILFVLVVQAQAILGWELADPVTAVLVILLLVPWALYVETAAKESAHVISLFGERGRSAAEQVCTRYEQQIRQAAGQEERNRLARDLHDSIKQQIFVIQTAAATVQTRFETDPGGARSALDQVRQSAREAMAEMEAMLDQLRATPLENNGLVEALKKQCEALEFRGGARVAFKLGDLPPNESLVPGAHQAIFRVAQEALANIGRHARPNRVTVQLDSAGGHVRLAIQDDGSGFDLNQAARGMGISNMRARAEELGGTFELQAQPGGGTTVRLSIPYVVAEPAQHGRTALGYAAALLLLLAYGATWRWAPFLLAPGVMLAVGFVRATLAYLRAPRQPEAAR